MAQAVVRKAVVIGTVNCQAVDFRYRSLTVTVRDRLILLSRARKQAVSVRQLLQVGTSISPSVNCPLNPKFVFTYARSGARDAIPLQN